IPDDETIAKAAAELQAEREAAAAREADAPVLRRREGSSRAQAAAPSGASPRAPKPELERVEKKLSRKEKRRRRKEKRRRKREDKKSAVVVLAKPRKRGSEIEEIDDFEEIVDDGAVREPTAEISADEIEEFEDIDEIDDEEIEEIDDYEEIDDDDFEEIDDDDD
ncbi:MAG: hypothetical protein KC486_33900, partial [Myxococcales bacterium]|nr:hypothetical protein [Myxococcales bacterium]